MVKVTGYQKRNSKEGNEYFALELQADELELIVSQKTGKHYATVKKCWMSCTFDENVCNMMIGKSLPGSIKKEACEAFSFIDEDSGEEITLSSRNVYCPVESDNMESVVLGQRQLQEI
jgi:hypothetical protein